MLRYLKSWTMQLRWQRLPAFEKLAHMLIDHLEGILNYCRVKVRFGVVEAINGNIKTLLRRIRGLQESRMKWASCRIPAQSPKVIGPLQTKPPLVA